MYPNSSGVARCRAAGQKLDKSALARVGKPPLRLILPGGSNTSNAVAGDLASARSTLHRAIDEAIESAKSARGSAPTTIIARMYDALSKRVHRPSEAEIHDIIV